MGWSLRFQYIEECALYRKNAIVMICLALICLNRLYFFSRAYLSIIFHHHLRGWGYIEPRFFFRMLLAIIRNIKLFEFSNLFTFIAISLIVSISYFKNLVYTWLQLCTTWKHLLHSFSYLGSNAGFCSSFLLNSSVH